MLTDSDYKSAMRQGRWLDGTGQGFLQQNAGNYTSSQSALQAARAFQGYAGQAQAAQDAAYGSIAARNDPNRYGSIASRQFGGYFGPTGAMNPQWQQQQADYQSGLQRRAMASQMDAMSNQQAQNTGLAAASFLAPYLQGGNSANPVGYVDNLFGGPSKPPEASDSFFAGPSGKTWPFNGGGGGR